MGGHQWQYFAVFAAAIVAMVVTQIPGGAIGLIAVNYTRPGVGIDLNVQVDSTQVQQFTSNTPTLASVLEHTVPASFFEAAAKNEVLQIVFFAILFAIGLAQVKSPHKHTVLSFLEGVSEVMFKFTGVVMLFAPIGIGAAVAVTVGRNGLGVLGNLAQLVGTLYGALIVFVLVALIPVALLFKIPVSYTHLTLPTSDLV